MKLIGANISNSICAGMQEDGKRGYNFTMPLTITQVEHIANLARLELSAAEKERYAQQLSAILEYFDRLQALDTSGIPATSSVLPPHAVLRVDEPRPGLPTQDLLRNAPQVENDQFRVPAVFEDA